MNRSILALTLLVSSPTFIARAQTPAPFTAVEVDPFTVNQAVALPAGYQTALADSIARELSVEFSTILILRQGEQAPDGHRVLRISGTVVQFKPASSAKRLLTGFGGGAVVAAGVRFDDQAAKRVVRIGEFQSAPDGLGKKIARFCKSEHLLDSN